MEVLVFVAVLKPDCFPFFRFLGCQGYRSPHLVLPRNGHTACGHFAVKGVIFGLKLHPLHSGELLDVQHVLTVDGLRLKVRKENKRNKEKDKVLHYRV